MGLGARIAELRRNKDESLQAVASAVGVTKTHIWDLEKGRTKNPSLSVIKGLADHFRVSIASLVEEDIDAADADQELGRMFRLARQLDETERAYLDDIIQSFLKRRKEKVPAVGLDRLAIDDVASRPERMAELSNSIAVATWRLLRLKPRKGVTLG